MKCTDMSFNPKRNTPVVALILILCFAVVVVSKVKKVNAVPVLGIVRIMPDGTVEGTDKIHRTGNVYTFTDDVVNQTVVVEKDDLVIDGVNHLLQGNGTGAGINVANRSKVIIRNLEIRDFNAGIGIYDSHNNTVVGNLLVNNLAGVSITDSDNNSIKENTVMDNENGIFFFSSHNNSVYGNSFINNTQQVCDNVGINPWLPQLLSVNFWDNGTVGNYWSDYSGTDTDGDGVGDTSYIINEDNQDNHPLMEPTETPGFTIPEFPDWMPLHVMLVVVAALAVIYRRNSVKNQRRVKS
ncbi:MAG: NosD domain-containing protein [Candidatus Bathyarchaeota archaeon]|jgi:parallel beta-helix repeat protein